MFPCKVGLVNDANFKQLFQGLQRLDKVRSPMPASKYAISQCLPLSLLLTDHESELCQGRNTSLIWTRSVCSTVAKTLGLFQEWTHCIELISVGYSFKGGFEGEKTSFWFFLVLTQILKPGWNGLWKVHSYRFPPNCNGSPVFFWEEGNNLSCRLDW